MRGAIPMEKLYLLVYTYYTCTRCAYDVPFEKKRKPKSSSNTMAQEHVVWLQTNKKERKRL
jgi:hypothetical protein